MSKFKFFVPKGWQKFSDQINVETGDIVSKNMELKNPPILDVLKKFEKQFKVLILDHVKIDAGIFDKLISKFQLDKLVINYVKIFISIRKKSAEPAQQKENLDDEKTNENKRT